MYTVKRKGELTGHGKWTRYLYNVAEFYADSLRSLPSSQMGKTSDSHILLLFLIQEYPGGEMVSPG